MYKTVRKGDASLQYTILPQTDQFPNGVAPATGSGKPRPRVVRYTMGTLMVLIILSCVATPFLMNQNDHNLFASTVLAMSRAGHGAVSTPTRNASREQPQTNDILVARSKGRVSTTTSTTTQASRRKDLDTGTTAIALDVPEVEDAEEPTSTDSFSSTAVQHTRTTSDSPTGIRHTLSPTMFSTSMTSSSTASRSSTSSSSSSATTESAKAVSSVNRKMPRVTLKLRENETIPQMYMKAGIASYKKGNITTSVLAHGLSLEGLIFKTPEGTIKPWPRNWFFADPSSEFQWKGPNQIPMTIFAILACLALLAIVSIILMFYLQRKAARRQRQCVEEPEAEGHEEDKSTLLGVENQETEDKE